MADKTQAAYPYLTPRRPLAAAIVVGITAVMLALAAILACGVFPS